MRDQDTGNAYAGSVSMHERARRCLAGGVSSNFRYASPVPLCIARGDGPCLWDVDGNRYVDYVLGNGPAILGHNPPAVIDAVRATLQHGQAFGAVHEAEVVLAERLVELLPCAEQVRFDVTGTQADQIAVRLARAYTGRERIVKFEGQYHGWADNLLLSVTPGLNEAGPRGAPVPVLQSRGQLADVRNAVIVQPFNDLAVLRATFARDGDRIAAVMMEPITCNTGVIEPLAGFLEGVQALCAAHGALLIFDEVITGFRAALGGAQARYGITPDLAVFAKAAAGGFPISIVAGRADVMSGVTTGVMHGGTYNGLTSSVAACAATLDELGRDGGLAYAIMERHGQRLMGGLVALGEKHGLPLRAQGIGPVFSTVFGRTARLRDYRDYKAGDEALRLRFVEALQQRGIRTTARGTWFLSTVLGEADIDETLSAADDALRSLR